MNQDEKLKRVKKDTMDSVRQGLIALQDYIERLAAEKAARDANRH